LRIYLKEIVAAPVKKAENTAVGFRCADHTTPSVHCGRLHIYHRLVYVQPFTGEDVMEKVRIPPLSAVELWMLSNSE
jgi:hypothetical protein